MFVASLSSDHRGFRRYRSLLLLFLFLPLFVEKSYFTFKLTFDLGFCPQTPPPSHIVYMARMLL